MSKTQKIKDLANTRKEAIKTKKLQETKENSTSLDEEEVNKKFYYKSKDSSVTYEAPIEVAKLSGLFTIMIDQQKSSSDEENTAVSLDVVQHTHETSNEQFEINTDRMLKYIDAYFKIWAETPAKANYVKEAVIQTNDIAHILKPDDLKLIRDYISDNVALITEGKRTDYPNFSLDKYKTDDDYNRSITLQLLNELLCQVDGFLEIESFTNKILAYIATIMWEVSLVNVEPTD